MHFHRTVTLALYRERDIIPSRLNCLFHAQFAFHALYMAPQRFFNKQVKAIAGIAKSST
jgi:hypothetical protein